MYFINKTKPGEQIFLSTMFNNKSMCIEKLHRMKQRCINNERELEMNKHKMTTDQVLARILVLSLEKKFYLEKEQEYVRFEKFLCYALNEDDVFIETRNENKISKNIEENRNENLNGIGNDFVFFSPTISNTNQVLIGDKKFDANWSEAINEVKSSKDLSYSMHDKDMKSIYNGKVKYRPFMCEKPGCKKRYTSLYGLKYHERNGHNKVYDESKPFKCLMPDCDKRYKNINGLRYHQEHGHKP